MFSFSSTNSKDSFLFSISYLGTLNREQLDHVHKGIFFLGFLLFPYLFLCQNCAILITAVEINFEERESDCTTFDLLFNINLWV